MAELCPEAAKHRRLRRALPADGLTSRRFLARHRRLCTAAACAREPLIGGNLGHELPSKRATRARTETSVEAHASRPDAELMATMRADEEALGHLLRRYARLVHRVAFDVLRDPAEAEDVTQEVFLEVYSRAHLYDPERGSVRVWLLQYAYHRSWGRKDVLRRRAAYRAETLDVVERGPRSPLPLSRQECGWILRAGLAHLPARQRAALELTWLHDLSLRDVADRLSVSLGSARHYYYRGLARLRAWARRVESRDATTPASGGARAASTASATRRPARATRDSAPRPRGRALHATLGARLPQQGRSAAEDGRADAERGRARTPHYRS